MNSDKSRVREMLYNLRFANANNQASPNVDMYRKSFTQSDTDPMVGGSSKNVYGQSLSPSGNSPNQYTVITVWVLSVIALTAIFLVLGQWLDNQLLEHDKDEAHVGDEYNTIAFKTCFQILFNLVLLVMPFLLVRTYARESLLCRYYFLVVFPLWVISLHAQTNLHRRLSILVQGDIRQTDASLLQLKKQRVMEQQLQILQQKQQQNNQQHQQVSNHHQQLYVDKHSQHIPVRTQRLQPNHPLPTHNTWSNQNNNRAQAVTFQSPLLEAENHQEQFVNYTQFSGGNGNHRATNISDLR